MNTSRSHVNQGFLGALLLFFATPSTAFTVTLSLVRHHRHDPLASSRQQRKRIQQPSALQLTMSPMDPVEYSIRLVEDLEPEIQASVAAPPSAGASSHWLSSSSASSPSLDLSSISSLKPAMGHTQPLWGPPDPYLSAGKSIAPSARALTDLGVTDPSSTGTAPPDTWPKLAQLAVQDGVRVLDSAALKAENFLPGFTPTGGILPTHSAPLETPASFAAQVEWSAAFLNVVDKLPRAAFVYCLVEFFFLRPGIDRYTDEVELEPMRALTESVAVTGVRLAMFCLVAAVTTTIFG